jgi:tetratricopeptide (TPR) repeat protein
MGFFYPQCICTLPGATITYTFDKIVASNADMFDDDTHDQHYPYHTDVAVSADGLSREDLIKQGTGLYMLGQYQHAADTYKKLVEMTDSDPVILAEYGTILVRLSRWNEAQNAFNQSINVRPDADILNAYGRVLLEMNRFDDALFAYNQSLKMNDASASAWAGRAEVLKNLDNPDDAVVAYEKSISLDEKEAAVWKGYGEVLTTLGKDDDAVKAYQKAIDLGMKGADIYLKLGGALRKTGQDGDAQRAMDSARSYQGALYSSSSNSILRCTAGGAM